MSFTSTASRIQYTASGSTTAFAFPYLFYDATHLKVWITGTNGVSSLKTLGTDYTVTGAGSSSGGTVTFGASPASGSRITIWRVVPHTQALDLVNNSNFDADLLEKSFDLATMAIQQLDDTMSRAIVLPATDTGIPLDPESYVTSVETTLAQARTYASNAALSATAAQQYADSVDAKTIPTASAIPRADAAGKLDPGWLVFADGATAVLGSNASMAVTPAALRIAMASTPAHYARSALATIASTTDATGRLTWVPPQRLTTNINDSGYYLAGGSAMSMNDSANWDATSPDYTVPANRAGKDIYVYACAQNTGVIKTLFSANSTYPSGYTASNSRKIGGFHCLCLSVGTISGHPLSGFLTGDIHPYSMWDLIHRPNTACAPEGMAFLPGLGVWESIYLLSWNGSKLVSAYGAAAADGASSWTNSLGAQTGWDWYDFCERMALVGMRPPTQLEFMAGASGSNEGTNISGSVDPVTTGGHIDTAGRRMVSNAGIEDCCGNIWQWLLEAGGLYNTSTAYADQYTARTSQRGQGYNLPNRGLAGGSWSDAAACGSRGSNWVASPLNLNAGLGARGVAEPLAVTL